MVQRLCCFLVVLLLIFQGEAFGQELLSIKQRDYPGFGQYYPGDTVHFRNCFPKQKIKIAVEKSYDTSILYKQEYFSLNPVRQDYYSQNLGFFCKKELQLDKITVVPFRFRLGSLEYVNWMEQKPNAAKPK